MNSTVTGRRLRNNGYPRIPIPTHHPYPDGEVRVCMMRKFRLERIELYREKIYFIHCSGEYLVRAVKAKFKKDIETPDPANQVACFRVLQERGFDVGLIWISNVNWPDITHECLHATHWVLGSKGMWMSESSEEAYCYLLGHLVDKIEGWVK